MTRRWLSMIPTAALALVVLAACGGEQATAPEEDVTRVPDAANAPAEQATEEATEEATEAAGGATPATGAQTVAGGAATPLAGSEDVTPAIVSGATPVSTADEATPVVPVLGGTEDETPTATATASADDEDATPAGAATPVGDVGSAATASEFTVTSIDIAFDPKQLTIPADQDVVVALPNEGASPHNFVIEALGIDVPQAPGETDLSTTINAPAGEYEYICSIPGHEQAGMVGTLIVE